jgi:hypothetical protein
MTHSVYEQGCTERQNATALKKNRRIKDVRK